jgi:hypothetical protein
MLAEFAKNRPCVFGLKFDLQTSGEELLHWARSFESFEDVFDPRREREDIMNPEPSFMPRHNGSNRLNDDELGRIQSEQVAISRITSRYGS